MESAPYVEWRIAMRYILHCTNCMAIRAAMCADRKQNEEKIVREWQINIYFIRPIKNNGINLKLAGKIKHVPQCNYCVMHLSARSFHFLGFFHFFFH